MDDRMLRAAKSALTQCMGITRKEVLLVITDEPLRRIGYAFWEAGKQLGVESIITEIVPRETNGSEPPDAVARLMSAVDVVIAPTSKSLSHTEARRKACAKGVPTACFLAAARAFNKGQPTGTLLPELESGCHPRDPSQSATEARATSCELLTCLKEPLPAPEAAKARREACAAADNAFAFEFPWASAGQPRLIARMPWVLDSANGGVALGALPRGGRWFCFKGSNGSARCERTQAGCDRRRSDVLSRAAPNATIDACDRGPAVAACFTYRNNGVIEAACTGDGGVACPDLRQRISAADPSANPSPCLSVGELF